VTLKLKGCTFKRREGGYFITNGKVCPQVLPPSISILTSIYLLFINLLYKLFFLKYNFDLQNSTYL
jgi:hypothetical protein